ncbi:MAG TPA: 4-hydroxy-tetrahydrodipicolinate synthase [Candidatus Deferrimicrobium sp.]|nr:4-hydroxy-tetrahydrodipicolinate synthase [Candidatus Deferrimicrobium sp.]
MNTFGRVITAMVTPFDMEGQVDYQQARKLARYLVENGSDGLVVSGTTGESPTLSFDEKVNLFRIIKEEVGTEVTVIAGTGSNDTGASIKLTQAAEQVGVDGIMLVVPYYNKPSQDGLYRHFAAIAATTSLPIVLYNVPGRTGVNMLPSTVAQLAEIPNIVAIKDASGSTDQATEMLRILPREFMLYCGDDSLTLPYLAIGATGIISVVSHVVGNELQEMVSCFLKGDNSQAAEIHSSLFPVFKGMFMTSNPVPIKAALNMLGLQVGLVRLPLVEATEKEQTEIRKLLIEAGKL